MINSSDHALARSRSCTQRVPNDSTATAVTARKRKKKRESTRSAAQSAAQQRAPSTVDGDRVADGGAALAPLRLLMDDADAAWVDHALWIWSLGGGGAHTNWVPRSAASRSARAHASPRPSERLHTSISPLNALRTSTACSRWSGSGTRQQGPSCCWCQQLSLRSLLILLASAASASC